MSNRAYLIASQDSTPAGRKSDGDANYDEQRDVLAEGGGYQLPVFWLSLFSESDICFHLDGEYRVSTLVCQRESALSQLEQRRDSVLAAFPGCEGHWRVWRNLVEGSTAAFFKVDATELWDLDPDVFEGNFRAAVRWFSSGHASDFETLLAMGILAFDSDNNHFNVGGSQLIGEHLYGYLMKASPPSGPPPLPASGPLPPPLPTQTAPQSKRPWWKPFSWRMKLSNKPRHSNFFQSACLDDFPCPQPKSRDRSPPLLGSTLIVRELRTSPVDERAPTVAGR